MVKNNTTKKKDITPSMKGVPSIPPAICIILPAPEIEAMITAAILANVPKTTRQKVILKKVLAKLYKPLVVLLKYLCSFFPAALSSLCRMKKSSTRL